jgi:hypothetical protein
MTLKDDIALVRAGLSTGQQGLRNEAYDALERIEAALAPREVRIARPEHCNCGTEYTCKIACTCDGYPHDLACHYGQGWDAVPRPETIVLLEEPATRLVRPK